MRHVDPSVVPGARPAPSPGFIEPCRPALRAEAPSGGRWIHEIKFDGCRAQAHLRNGQPDPLNGHIDAFRISHIQCSDGWIETTWNNMSDPGAFAAAGAEEEGGGGEPPPLAGAGVVVRLMA